MTNLLMFCGRPVIRKKKKNQIFTESNILTAVVIYKKKKKKNSRDMQHFYIRDAYTTTLLHPKLIHYKALVNHFC